MANSAAKLNPFPLLSAGLDASASSTLPALSQAPNPGLAGYVAAYYLPQADLLASPVLASPGLVSAPLALRSGAVWLPLPYTPHTLKFEEVPQTERGVTTYQRRVTAQRPQASAAVLSALASLDRRPLLLLLVEATGSRRLLGSREEYVLLSTTGEGQNPATRAGVELRFEGQATERAPYYTGAVPVLGGGGSLPAVSAAGYVRLQDAHGNLLASVPPGTVVTVRSSFKVVLSY